MIHPLPLRMTFPTPLHIDSSPSYNSRRRNYGNIRLTRITVSDEFSRGENISFDVLRVADREGIIRTNLDIYVQISTRRDYQDSNFGNWHQSE